MDKKKIAEYIVSELKKRGTDEGECSVSETVTTEVDYTNGKIGMIRTTFNNRLAVKVINGGKKGASSINSIDKADIDSAIDDAFTNSESSLPDPAEGVCDCVCTRDFDEGEREADLESLYARTVEFLEQTKRDYPSISFDSLTSDFAFESHIYMNTLGTSMSSTSSAYSFSPVYMARNGDVSSSFNYSYAAMKKPDVPFMSLGVTEQLIKETEKQLKTKSIDGKFVGTVIITPQCMEDILSTVESNFLSDRVILDGTSLFKDSIGKQVAAPSVTVYSAPRSKELVAGYAYTSDGYEAKDAPLIEKGILRNFSISLYTSRKTGIDRSPNDGGCYIMDAGDTKLSDMIKSVKKGILLNRFSGGEPGVNGDITGVAKNSFLIEDGKITDAISETMVSGNLTKMIMDVSEISSERANSGTFILPWVKTENITISGK